MGTVALSRLEPVMLRVLVPAFLLLVAVSFPAGRAEGLEVGNPYATYLNAWLRTAPAVPRQDDPVTDTWRIRTVAQDALVRTWGLTDPQSNVEGLARQVLHDQVQGQIEYILGQAKDGRWWWEGSGRVGDPNVDRFVLHALVDALYRLRKAGLYPERMDDWLRQTRKALEFQLREYGQRTDRDWSTVAAGHYPNMDAAYTLIMGIAGELYDDPRYTESAREFMRALEESLLPDGGFNYISVSNEVYQYHEIVVKWVARYFQVTGDPLAEEVLARTANYYPLYLAPPGIPERTSHVWWKHSGPLTASPAGPEIVASFANDGRNKWLAQRLLSNLTPYDAYYAVDFWRPDIEPVAPADRYVLYDGNISGVRGRFGDFSWVGTLGVSQDAFAGAVIADRTMVPASIDSSLLLVTPEVGLGLSGPLMNRAAYISGLSYPKSLVIADQFAALSVTYRPRRPANPPDEYPEQPWTVRQTWLFLPTNVVGLVSMESDEEQRGRYVRMRVRTEPLGKLRQLEPDLYAAGKLRLRMLDHNFPVVRIDKAVPHDWDHDRQPNADEIFFEEEPLTERPWRLYTKGQEYRLALDAHPEWNPGVASFAQIRDSDFVGFSVAVADAHYTVLFNTKDEARGLRLPGGIQGLAHDVGLRVGRVYISSSDAHPAGGRTPTVEVSADELVEQVVPPYGTAVIVWTLETDGE